MHLMYTIDRIQKVFQVLKFNADDLLQRTKIILKKNILF